LTNQQLEEKEEEEIVLHQHPYPKISNQIQQKIDSLAGTFKSKRYI